MEHGVRLRIEQEESQRLSPNAALASSSKGRRRPEPDDPIRTCYQRDRDRILHSKAFRRLKHKTQVFIAPVGDHFRTRLTHTLEVSQIARTISRALRLNEDLTEAIALGHDVGHPPFGHTGEQALDECVQAANGGKTGFRHYDQSLRILDVLEELNLTHEVLAGIAGHSKGQSDLSEDDGQVVSTLEAAVVRVSDRIAYLSHDIDDAIRAGVIASIPERFAWLGQTQSARIRTMVYNVVENSVDVNVIKISPDLLAAMNDLKDWMFEHVYLEPHRVRTEAANAKEIVRLLFDHYQTPGNLPEGFEGLVGTVDYISGMTDRFAIETARQLGLGSG